MSTTPKDLIALVEKFARPRIMLIGDVMVDEYIYGDAERLSPEAPVPVVQERYREQRAGGAGNVAAGLAALGAQVLIVSVCGNDFQGKLLQDIFRRMPNGGGGERGRGGEGEREGCVNTDGLFAADDRPTTAKIRLVGLAQHRHPQQMLRLDQEVTTPITASQQQQLLAYIHAELPTCDALALEDYNKGLLTPTFCQEIIAIARSLRKPILVDPALISDYSKYNGVSIITPNRFEAEKAAGVKLDNLPPPSASPSDPIPLLAETLRKNHQLEACLLTLDRQGMYLLDADGGTWVPTRPRHVYDVTGAGDMVLSALTMAMASGASWLQAANIANIAGGLEVEKFGIVPITKDEIIAELYRMDVDALGKERSLPDLLKDLACARKAAPSKKMVFTNGVFDILHAGHVQYLDFARKQGDLLIVGVNSDASVRRLKGPTRPVNPLADRMAVLAALQSVDYVIAFEEDTPANLIAAVKPDVLVKGEDYAGKEVVGRETVEQSGGKVILAPLLKGRSTTGVIEKFQCKVTR
ncbi:MAG: D-glycero-beta-D-manno-heptose 1-phosphate adenylyltransferase [Phycisphaerales bacterium]|nr:D-glycero-beta-D-manno-heptose 1-phosphate adenylyltransferase [Phycisphaerales bacterium]